MLKNQEAVPEPPTSVSQARVTPEELTQALAAIEARRQAEAKTIPLDQAVSELHLDSTSDEIWAEVQAQRAKAAAQQTGPPQTQIDPRLTSPRSQRFRGWPVLIAPAIALWIVGNAILTANGHHHAPVAAPILHPLAQEPETATVYADDSSLAQISQGVPASKIFVSESAGDNRWKLIKLQGHVYLQRYIAHVDALQSLQGKAFNVYNDSDSGDLEGVSTSDIRLRVDKIPLLKAGGDSDYSEVTIPNFQPDPLTTLSDGR